MSTRSLSLEKQILLILNTKVYVNVGIASMSQRFFWVDLLIYDAISCFYVNQSWFGLARELLYVELHISIQRQSKT